MAIKRDMLNIAISRSREGAWIEIKIFTKVSPRDARRSREGAWIEMPLTLKTWAVCDVAPARERGLK